MLLDISRNVSGNNSFYTIHLPDYESGLRNPAETLCIYKRDPKHYSVMIQTFRIQFFPEYGNERRFLNFELYFTNKHDAELAMIYCTNEIILPSERNKKIENPVLRAMHAFRDRITHWERLEEQCMFLFSLFLKLLNLI